MKKIPFRVSAKTARLIGRENVASSEGAITELVKNTYDADARHCVLIFDRRATLPENIEKSEISRVSSLLPKPLSHYYDLDMDEDGVIVAATRKQKLTEGDLTQAEAELSMYPDIWIIDNGSGMTAEVVESRWMVIGTDHKENEAISAEGRVRTGAKGIGRFALDRLGTAAFMLSSAKKTGVDTTSTISWAVNWNEFEDASKTLDDVKADLGEVIADYTASSKFVLGLDQVEGLRKLRAAGKPTGTAIRISNCRDRWDIKDVSRLFRTLNLLLPPSDQRDFKIFVYDTSSLGSFGRVGAEDALVILPVLTGFGRRLHAAIFSFCAGVMPPMPMLGRSLL